jgi:hypothetical protein
MFQLNSSPSSLGQTFKTSFELYKHILIKCLPLTLLIGILKAINDTIVPDLIQTLADKDGLYHFHNLPVSMILLGLASGVLVMSLYYLVINASQNHPVSLADLFSKGLLGGLIALISYALFAVIVGGLMFGLIHLLHFLPSIGHTLSILLIIGCVWYLLIPVAFWLPMVVMTYRPWCMLKLSFKYIYGHWWSSFLVFLLAVLSIVIVIGVISYILTIIGLSETYTTVILALFGSIFMLPWFMSVIAVQLNNLKLRYEKTQSN